MTHPGATPSDKHKVVIIGSGFGGLSAAKKLAGRRRHQDDCEDHPSPVSAAAVSGGHRHHLRRRDSPADLRILRKQKNCQVLLGEVTNVDLQRKTVDSVLLGHTYRTPTIRSSSPPAPGSPISAATSSPSGRRA